MDVPEKLTLLRHDSPTGPTCPAIYAGSASRYVVGKKVTKPQLLDQMAVGDDETVVEIPASLLPEVEGA